ncbi:response regulator transcription factor [Nocardia ignorata]|uniref:response regulator transcription factor n=1 Tax=Nocardia ignorata TaxID=145285 RepID=UPI00105C0DAF
MDQRIFEGFELGPVSHTEEFSQQSRRTARTARRGARRCGPSPSTTVEYFSSANEEKPSGEQLALILLLAEGLTDDAIGRRIGISERTVRRRVAVIVELLGARSRFEAGAKSVAAGWLGVRELKKG